MTAPWHTHPHPDETAGSSVRHAQESAIIIERLEAENRELRRCLGLAARADRLPVLAPDRPGQPLTNEELVALLAGSDDPDARPHLNVGTHPEHGPVLVLGARSTT